MTDIILKFPNSKRKLTAREEQLIKSCSNQIYNIISNDNPFIRAEQRISYIEDNLKTLIKRIHELDEDKK